jgi:hypothetical protein
MLRAADFRAISGMQHYISSTSKNIERIFNEDLATGKAVFRVQ